MAIKGTYTGRQITLNDIYFDGKNHTKIQLKIGKITGWHGTGEPVYELLLESGRKVGEMGNNFIKKELRQNKWH